MSFSMFLVTFREGLEAFLIIAMTSAFLHQAGQNHLKKILYIGGLFALGLCVLLTYFLVDLGGLGHGWEAGLAFIAAALMVSCAHHMIKHGPHIKNIIIEKLKNIQSQKRASWLIFLFAILMIGREGLEAGVLLASLAQQQQMNSLFFSGLLGLLAASGIAVAGAVYGKRLNLKAIFQASTAFICVFSVQLILYAIHEATEGNLLPWVNNDYLHEITEVWGPEGWVGQMLSYALFIVPVLWLVMHKFKDAMIQPKQA